MDTHQCPVCGTQSLVTTVSRNPEGGLSQFCSECERRRLWKDRSGVREIARGSAKLMVYAGGLLAVLTLVVDRLPISGGTGFGWRQITGTEVGIVCVVLSFFVRRGLLGIAGLFLLVLSLGADVLNVGSAPGLGWRSQTALVLAIALLAAGMLWQLVLRRADAASPKAGIETAPR